MIDVDDEERAFREELQVGDVVRLKGAGVPGELEAKFFRVSMVKRGEADLDGPFDDEACTVRYRKSPPTLRERGWLN